MTATAAEVVTPQLNDALKVYPISPYQQMILLERFRTVAELYASIYGIPLDLELSRPLNADEFKILKFEDKKNLAEDARLIIMATVDPAPLPRISRFSLMKIFGAA